MAERIRRELGADVELKAGSFRELSILVDGEKVLKKGWFTTPSDEEILDAVKKRLSSAK